MRHKKYTFKIGRTSSHRKALIANMLSSLIKHNRIKTTITKAKGLRKYADKVVTLAKKQDLHNRRQAISKIRDTEAVGILFSDLAERFKERNGGYTRIIRIGNRRGDNSELCFIEYVEKEIKK